MKEEKLQAEKIGTTVAAIPDFHRYTQKKKKKNFGLDGIKTRLFIRPFASTLNKLCDKFQLTYNIFHQLFM